MKSKIKLTESFIKKSGIELDINSIPEKSRYIKRISTDINDVMLSGEDDESMECNGWISTVEIDSDGEIVLPEAIDLTRFDKNPVVLYNHKLDSLPIGKCVSLTKNDYGIIARTKFATTRFAKDIYKLIKEKMLNTFSIGFIPVEKVNKGTVEFMNIVKNLQEKHGDKFKDISGLKSIVTKAIMYEYSIVDVPANEDALILMVKSMDKTTQDIIIDHKNILMTLPINVIEQPVQVIEEVPEIKIIRQFDIKVIGYDYSDKINNAISKYL